MDRTYDGPVTLIAGESPRRSASIASEIFKALAASLGRRPHLNCALCAEPRGMR